MSQTQQRPKMPTVTDLACMLHKLHQRYILYRCTRVTYGNSPGMRINTRYMNSTRGTASNSDPPTPMRLWWSLCTLCLLACQVRVPVGDSGLCCCLFDIFQGLINSLVGCFCTGALGFVLFHIVNL